MEERIGPVSAPSLIRDGLIPPDTPTLHTRTRPSSWADWKHLADQNAPRGEEHWFDHFYLSLQAAVSGLGVAIGPLSLVFDDLQSGRLVAPFGFMADGTRYCAISPLPISDDPRKVRFVKWLRAEAESLSGVHP